MKVVETASLPYDQLRTFTGSPDVPGLSKRLSIEHVDPRPVAPQPASGSTTKVAATSSTPSSDTTQRQGKAERLASGTQSGTQGREIAGEVKRGSYFG